MLSYKKVIVLGLERQCFLSPADEIKYDALFTLMSPVPTVYWSEPGCPPCLPQHAGFDDASYNQDRRSKREILKGRFGGGLLAYVTKEDLELFACLYKKDVSRFSLIQTELMDLLEKEGPMNIGMMKEFTGLLVKEITPALHRLQEAFIVYEDQVDKEGDRSWYLFEREFPEIDLMKYTKGEALEQLIPRFCYLHVFITEDMVKSYYKLPNKLIQEILNKMVLDKVITEVTLQEKAGYMLCKDYQYLMSQESETLLTTKLPSVLLLQRNDFLVRGHGIELKDKFQSEWDTLYYILIDGCFRGAVKGKFKFGPHVIEDIMLDLPTEDRKRLKQEITDAVYQIFDPMESPIKSWN